jgi:hypothetical protein
MSLAPMNEESTWLNEGKNHIGKKIISQLSACDVTRVVSLDTNNLTTKRKSMKRVESFERYVIFSCYYLLICLSNGFCFVVLTCHFRFNLQMVFNFWMFILFQFVLH